MKFGLMFFASAAQTGARELYELIQSAAVFADRQGFTSVWTPERHFQEFGGFFPNPAVLSAALASITRRVQLRAGSLISPLHHTIRVAEEWALVDNLSGGRVGVSFGSGWNVDDFVFFPERYADRQSVMFDQIQVVQRLWAGQTVSCTNTFEKPVDVRLSPRPVQPSLPVWVTSSGNIQTFVRAGEIGANVLTHLVAQDAPALAAKIAAYREARERSGLEPDTGEVTLMLHTFVGGEMAKTRRQAAPAMREYLRSAIALEKSAARGGGTVSGGRRLQADSSDQNLDELLDITVERYLDRGSLIGTVESCAAIVDTVAGIGVTEIACLIDFGVEHTAVLEGLPWLEKLQDRCRQSSADCSMELIQQFSEAL
ncbi:MAG TPA: MupA/Atu3671 family FMN-dependent luciferase-like monooxygenase [Bryobacteraceae bacterium]|jgi:natural product biosynthesis luciferase-like monooxygenase protein|nr:MupA/Atu3671 family FMN-dependent luciferase-like monooxygenase [Bryobacteraceae bacterium]